MANIQKIPTCSVNELILRLDAATLIRSEKILERTEHHDGGSVGPATSAQQTIQRAA